MIDYLVDPADSVDWMLSDLYLRMMQLHAERMDRVGMNYWRKQHEELWARRKARKAGTRVEPAPPKPPKRGWFQRRFGS